MLLDVLVSSTIQKILPKVDDFVTTVDNLEQSDSRSSCMFIKTGYSQFV